MNGLEFPELIQGWAQDFLTWVGFGTIVGLLAKAIMPGKDPGGPVATLLMGIAGAIIGCGSVSFFYDGPRITPISPVGMVLATIGAFIILAFYRLLAGYWIDETALPEETLVRRRTARRRRRRMAPVDEYEY